MNMDIGDSSKNLVEGKILSKRSKYAYTRAVLLSLGESEKCQTLPSGFDKSMLSELEDSHQERFRFQNNVSSQNYRRTDYGSPPPNRGDTNSHSRMNQGRWDSRPFSSKTDRDSESQSELDADSARQYSNSGRRPWQVREQDGLLGSGSFLRPPGFTSGTTVPKVLSGDNSSNRISQTYQPPRPYKATSVPRRDNNDSYNDETFSSAEHTSEDRVEEERKRRASFEQMRKEQHKTFHEKQKTGNFSPSFDFGSLIENQTDDSRQQAQNNVSDETVLQHVSRTDFSKSSVSVNPPFSRPVVPPGFSSSTGEKNFGAKSLSHSLPIEVADELEGRSLLAKEKKSVGDKESITCENQVLENIKSSEVQVEGSSVQEFLGEEVTSGRDGLRTFEGQFNVDLDSESIILNNSKVEYSQAQSTSILDNLFNNLSVNESINEKGMPNISGSGSLQECVKSDPLMVNSQSSKFAQWFLEDENSISDGPRPNAPNDLLSLIVGCEQSSSIIFDSKATREKERMMSLSHEVSGKPEMPPPILTCEDLEYSIMSEVTIGGSSVPPAEVWCSSGFDADQHEEAVDNHASQHLLSLLQKGSEDCAVFSHLSPKMPFKPQVNEDKVLDVADCSIGRNPLTLESLFGTAFMKELKSGSVQQPDNKSPPRLVGVNGSLSTVEDRGPVILGNDGGGSIQIHHEHSSHIGVNSENDFPRYTALSGSKPISFDESEALRSHEDIIVYDGDNEKRHEYMHARNILKPELRPPGDVDSGISGNVFPSNLAFVEERQIIGSHGPSPFPHLQSRDSNLHHSGQLHQPSPSQLLHSQFNNSGFMHLIGSHSPQQLPSSQMMFMPSDDINLRDHSVPSFGANIIQPFINHPGSAPTGFEMTTHNPLFQHVQMPPDVQHLQMQGFPRVVPFSHQQNPISGFAPDPYAMQGFPFGQGSPLNLNVDNAGLTPPRGPPEISEVPQHDALQVLIEMEHRANSKQPNPQLLRAWPQSRRVRS